MAYGLITRSPVPRLWWVGLPLTLFGLALTVFHFGQPLQVDVLGVVLSVLNGVIIAVYNILSAKVFARVHNQQLGTTWVNTGAMLAGLGLIFVFGFNLPDSLVGWSLLIALGIFGTLVPILALNAGLQMVGAARGSVIMTMQPVIAVLISTIFLGDVLTPQQWIGGAVVILAIVLLQRSPDRAAKTDGI